MSPRPLVAALAIAGAAAVLESASPAATASAQEPIPRTEGWVIVVSRCVICHSLEIAVQQRQGPHGWGQLVDRMVSYGMPLTAEERQTLIAYLVRHFGDPAGR
jgi:cytochrome c2